MAPKRTSEAPATGNKKTKAGTSKQTSTPNPDSAITSPQGNRPARRGARPQSQVAVNDVTTPQSASIGPAKASKPSLANEDKDNASDFGHHELHRESPMADTQPHTDGDDGDVDPESVRGRPRRELEARAEAGITTAGVGSASTGNTGQAQGNIGERTAVGGKEKSWYMTPGAGKAANAKFNKALGRNGKEDGPGEGREGTKGKKPVRRDHEVEEEEEEVEDEDEEVAEEEEEDDDNDDNYGVTIPHIQKGASKQPKKTKTPSGKRRPKMTEEERKQAKRDAAKKHQETKALLSGENNALKAELAETKQALAEERAAKRRQTSHVPDPAMPPPWTSRILDLFVDHSWAQMNRKTRTLKKEMENTREVYERKINDKRKDHTGLEAAVSLLKKKAMGEEESDSGDDYFYEEEEGQARSGRRSGFKG